MPPPRPRHSRVAARSGRATAIRRRTTMAIARGATMRRAIAGKAAARGIIRRDTSATRTRMATAPGTARPRATIAGIAIGIGTAIEIEIEIAAEIGTVTVTAADN